jgi:hypothetical protein
LTARPEWACFRRSLSVLMPRPNLEYSINHGLFTMFSVSQEIQRDEGGQNRTRTKRKINTTVSDNEIIFIRIIVSMTYFYKLSSVIHILTQCASSINIHF